MSNKPEVKPRPKTSEILTQLLSRKGGADLATLMGATGWQPHSVRAALSGLRKCGFVIDRQPPKTKGGGTIYRITSKLPAKT